MPPKKREMAEAATKAQKEALFNFLAEHSDLARGLLRGTDARGRAKSLWIEISASLNAMGGSTKSVGQWQRVWFDKKSNVKHSAALCNRSADVPSGGGPSTAKDLTEEDLKVLAIMGDGFGEPQTTAKVPAFPSQSQQNLQSESTELMSPSVSPVSTAELPPRSQTRPQQCQDGQSSTSQRQPRRVQRRRVQVTSDDSVRSRLFHLEELRLESDNRRNEELAGIKQALLELCSLVNKFIGNV